MKAIKKPFNLGDEIVEIDPYLQETQVPLSTVKALFQDALTADKLIAEVGQHITFGGGDKNPYLAVLKKTLITSLGADHADLAVAIELDEETYIPKRVRLGFIALLLLKSGLVY